MPTLAAAIPSTAAWPQNLMTRAASDRVMAPLKGFMNCSSRRMIW